MEPCTSHPNLKKLKTSTRKKLSIYPQMKPSSSNIKKILIFSQKKTFLIFSQKKPFLIFPKTQPREKFLYFRKRKPRKKFLYFLYFRKWNF